MVTPGDKHHLVQSTMIKGTPLAIPYQVASHPLFGDGELIRS